ncbi:hypothetical protein HAX54_025957 [Datura stramonium]|uniref:NADH-quinone oxidoreductase subunit D domain-containing protein n=1 Tax=Datura stramonium TaxID=4076 RepID=A0ABS8V0C3_DATST|nr:hypothetical protein [Datura stramonium]
MGPQHPSMHGVLRLIVTLDGEDIVDCEPTIGVIYIEDGENCGKLNNYTIFALCNTAKLYPSHYVGVESDSFSLLWLGPFMADIGAQTPFFYVFREREVIYDLFEAATGDELGFIGPMLRASGIEWDLRKVDHYESYDEFDWRVQWQREGDSLARYLVHESEK